MSMWTAIAADTLVTTEEVSMVVVAAAWSALTSDVASLTLSALALSFGPSGPIVTRWPCVLLCSHCWHYKIGQALFEGSCYCIVFQRVHRSSSVPILLCLIHDIVQVRLS